jgi:hypothetical protein
LLLPLSLHFALAVVFPRRHPELSEGSRSISQTPAARIFPPLLLQWSNRKNQASCVCPYSFSHPDPKAVISTEAAHSFIVSSTAEKFASLPKLFRSHDVVAVAFFLSINATNCHHRQRNQSGVGSST